MESNVLMTRAMPERHTGDNIAQRLQDCVSEFDLDGKIETCVHDNARNMENAGSKCDQRNDLGCFGHTLQLCIKPALEYHLWLRLCVNVENLSDISNTLLHLLRRCTNARSCLESPNMC